MKANVASEDQIHVFDYPHLSYIGTIKQSSAVKFLLKVRKNYQHRSLIAGLENGEIAIIELPDDLPKEIALLKEEKGN